MKPMPFAILCFEMSIRAEGIRAQMLLWDQKPRGVVSNSLGGQNTKLLFPVSACPIRSVQESYSLGLGMFAAHLAKRTATCLFKRSKFSGVLWD